MENFSLKLSSCVSLVKHPSWDGGAIYLINIAAEVLVFIKDLSCFGLRRGDLHHVACWIFFLIFRLRGLLP